MQKYIYNHQNPPSQTAGLQLHGLVCWDDLYSLSGCHSHSPSSLKIRLPSLLGSACIVFYIFSFSVFIPCSWDPTRCSAPSTGGPNRKRMWTCWSESGGGHKDDHQAGAPLLERQGERAEVVLPGEVSGETSQHLPVPKGGLQESWSLQGHIVTAQGALSLNWKRFKIDTSKKFFTEDGNALEQVA